MRIREIPIAILLCCTLLFGLWSITDAQSGGQNEDDVYLPFVSNDSDLDGQTPDSSPTPPITSTATSTAIQTSEPPPSITSTPSATPSATADVVATAISTSEPTTQPTNTPTATEEPIPSDWVPAADGECASGSHLIHQSGFVGIVNPDDFEPEVDGWDGYYCAPDESADAITCSENGTANVVDGIAVCTCSEGFVGGQCELPAPVLNEPAVRINGSADSIEDGQIIELSAEATSQVQSANVTALGLWIIAASDGCLLATADSEDCLTSYQGESVFYKAPEQGDGLRAIEVQFQPQVGPPIIETVLVQPPGYIPINGYGRPQLEPILDALEDFMQSRCVGAGLLGVSYYGFPIGVWGLGKIHGRSSSEVFNPECPGDDVDPHYPEAPNVSYTSPFKIGSVSKAVMFAVGRWVIKNRLAELDTDVDVVSTSSQRLVTAIRNADGNLQLDSWSVNAAGVQSHAGSINAERVRDFSLTTLNEETVVSMTRTEENGAIVTVWLVDGDGTFQQLDQAGILDAKRVSLTAVSSNRIVAAITRKNDNTVMVVWDVTPEGELLQRSVATAGRARGIDITNVSITSINSQQRVVIAAITDDSLPKLINWDIDNAGMIVRGEELELPYTVKAVSLEALTNGRLVIASQSLDDIAKVQVVEIAGTGLFTAKEMEEAESVDQLTVRRTGPSGFSVAVRRTNGLFHLWTWTVNSLGDMTRVEDATAGVSQGAALANIIYPGGDTFNSIIFAAVRTAESELKIVPWNVTGSSPFRLDSDILGDPIVDYSWSDDDIEALSLFGYDIPEGLLPPQLDQLFGGKAEVPPLNPPLDDVTTDGKTCSALTGGFADPQWRDVTLRHLFSHSTGMPKSAVSYNTVVQNYLDEIRGLNSRADFGQQELQLRSLWGDSDVENARALLGWDGAQSAESAGYLVPGATLDEILMVVAARCLPVELGQYRYSNTTPGLVRRIAEHITGTPYAADIPVPNYLSQHEGSLLQQFFQSELGISTGADDGIFASNIGIISASDGSEPGPTARAWSSGNVGTEKVYPKGWDRKRPHCIMSNEEACNFDAWASASGPGRINWYWENEEVRLPYWTTGYGASTGGLRIEALPFLSFLSKYWTGGYTPSNPRIGEKRNNTWHLGTSHNGSTGGGYAWALQYGNFCPIAEGVDVIVAVNQNSDVTAQSYSQLESAVRNAVCNEVEWAEIEPYWFFEIVE